MRGDAEKGGSYRCTPKLMVHSECLCCDRLRGSSSLFPIPASTLQPVPAPLQLWMLAGAHGTDRLALCRAACQCHVLGLLFLTWPEWLLQHVGQEADYQEEQR